MPRNNPPCVFNKIQQLQRDLRALVAVFLIALVMFAAPSLTRGETRNAPIAAPAPPPTFWDPEHEPAKPELAGMTQIRFLTEDDYPPFNFLLANGRIAGFNVDLARAVCAELGLACTIQRRAWDLLIPALEDNSGDAIIASLAINDETRKQVDFTSPYLLTPGRFVMAVDTTLKSASPEAIEDRSVAVVAGSRHEAFLKAFYPKATRVAFET
ncbi:MAG: transporter substrate-binding domain-containing protein, partial [Methylocystis sp.]|nr:transporter substrate-binding domain-containing protein [Methylocystis sp.]